jgi:hypothetical protein
MSFSQRANPGLDVHQNRGGLNLVAAREVQDRQIGAVVVSANYSNLGTLLIVVALISMIAPLMAILIVQASWLRTHE